MHYSSLLQREKNDPEPVPCSPETLPELDEEVTKPTGRNFPSEIIDPNDAEVLPKAFDKDGVDN